MGWVRLVSKGESIVPSRVKASRPRGYFVCENSARTVPVNHRVRKKSRSNDIEWTGIQAHTIA